ncbi:hypothetical protein [Thalassotalea agarivorans]|uniref:Uncharacterized protein n=1 Tax=Thalassotalea agarivorans TaxID=349064 RepID=A0A1H9Y6V4_THASX|nr:hypothetical protein [Thalassotalea agarivorans]SES64618.1 hypothetical protein SAMN05660429_00103 [Thalassotalea agarivorans]
MKKVLPVIIVLIIVAVFAVPKLMSYIDSQKEVDGAVYFALADELSDHYKNKQLKALINDAFADKKITNAEKDAIVALLLDHYGLYTEPPHDGDQVAGKAALEAALAD